ncbi:MAG: hypothetical protein RL719_602 [Actinomycetota bacterium]|jgi:uncharacterized protein (TIGR01777 family)
MRVLISGASGLVGTELRAQLKEAGHEPISLVRRPAFDDTEVEWHPELGFITEGAMEDIDAVVNLAGATTGRLPWTKSYKKLLISSRLDSTRTLVEAIRTAKKKPKVLISGSASGFYGDTGNESKSESAPKGTGFLSDLAAAWEQEALKAQSLTRVVLIRTTLVMSRKLGALGRLLPLVKLGVGGPLGPGKQWWAFISLRDEARAIIHLINNTDASGAFNLTAPESATCAQMVSALAKKLNRPAFLPVPSFALRVAFGEGADELLICNQQMTADRLLKSGFKFEHPTLESAVDYVLS